MTNSVKFRPYPGADLVQANAPMVRAYQTVSAYQSEHGEIGLTKSGAWNRHCIDWVVRRMDFPNWTVEKLYSVNKVLNEYDVPPLEYLRVLLTSLRLGRKMGSGWRLTKPGMALAGDPEAAYAKIAPAFLFRPQSQPVQSQRPVLQPVPAQVSTSTSWRQPGLITPTQGQ